MSLTRNKYRLLILITINFYVIYFCYRNLFFYNFDNDTQKILTHDRYGSIINNMAPNNIDPVLWGFFIISIVCFVGLLAFKRWAVMALLVVDVIYLMLLPAFTGIVILSPLEQISKSLFLMSNGALLSIALFSEINKEFT